MRSFGLIPALFALNAAMHAAAAPAPSRATEVLPLPVLGDFTIGMVGPTSLPSLDVPNPSSPGGGLPKAPGVPVKRAVRGNARIQPREFHSADFSASSPNNTIPVPPPTPTAAIEKRAKPAHKANAAHDPEEQPTGNSAHPAQGAADAVKGVGAIPKQVSPLFYSLPLGQLPDTPVTSSDVIPADEQLPAPPPPPAHVPEAAPTTVDPNAYPSSAGYPTSSGYQSGSSDFKAPPSPGKRHDFVLDTDPLIPPSDGAPRDPRMGLVNLDSNRKPEPLPAAPKVPKPDVPAAPNAPPGVYPGTHPDTPDSPDTPDTPDTPNGPATQAPPP